MRRAIVKRCLDAIVCFSMLLGMCGCEIKIQQQQPSQPQPIQVPPGQAAQIGKGLNPDRLTQPNVSQDNRELRPRQPASQDEPGREASGNRRAAERSEPSSEVDKACGWIEREIRDALKLRNTLVVWLVDQSPTAAELRRGASGQIDRLLGDVPTVADKHLEMAVVAYGSAANVLTPEPLADAAKLRSAVSEIKEYSGDTTLAMTAVSQAIERFLAYRTRGYEVIFVIVGAAQPTDLEQADQSIAALKRAAVPVFGVGPAARFAMPAFSDDRRLRRRRRLEAATSKPVSESRYPERIQLAPAGGDGPASLTDAGYGPFGLERICRLTGGRFFRLRPADDLGWEADPESGAVRAELLAKYTPDYGSEEQYQQLLAENKCRMALHQAALLPPAAGLENPRTDFPKEADEAAMSRTLTAAQRAAAEREQPIQKLYDALVAGEADRARLTGARWQAGYDLAMGQVLAAKARLDGYNAILATLKQGKRFENPGSTRWVLEPADEIAVASALDKMAKNSREYLKRVAREHKGTPWAAVAEHELRHPAGWKLREE